MATGKPVPGAEVNLKNEKWQPVSGRRTDAEGSVNLPLAKDLAWLTVRLGGDAHTMAMGSEATELPMVAFSFPFGTTSGGAMGGKTRNRWAHLCARCSSPIGLSITWAKRHI